MELRISLAGHLRIEVDGTPVAGPGLGSLGRLALAYLVAERHRPVPTDELARVLWEDDPPPTWRTALRGLVSKLRALLTGAGLARDQILESGPGWYQLCLPEGTVVDVEEAVSSLRGASEALRDAGHYDAVHAERARTAAAAVLHVTSLSFLVGTAGAWVERRRGELAELRVQALEVSAGAHTVVGDTTAAVARAEEAVGLQPLRESAHVALMAAHAAGGNRGAALRAYQRCRCLLAEELGVDPSPQTEAAYLGLLGTEPSEAARPAGAAGGAVPPAGPSPGLSLPTALTSFVGRRVELAEARRLLAGTRLLTVTGPGGVGKSRLALQVAHELAAEAAAGAGAAGEGAAGEREEVALVELAPLAHPGQLRARVAGLLGLAEEPAGNLGRRLVDHLARRRLLLVLDNCEHLVAACADLAHELLTACPQVRIMATSQTRLQVPGETAWALAPLAVPHLEARRVEEVLASEAGALFVARASAARPGLVVDDADVAVVARLCRRLDGLPLALELAAAQARLRSLEEIARELDVRFDLLAGGPRTGPARHQTLRATLDWSYGRLTDGQARLLARLSVFAGGFDLDAARAVAFDHPDGAPDLYPDLAGLVDASLVQADPSRRVARYGLLETVRHDARQRLEASGEATRLCHRHLAWATSLAEAAAPALEGARQREILDRLEEEHANLSAALAWAVSGDAARSALPLAAALGRYWEVRGHLSEGRAWLDRALADPQRPPELAPARARALGAAAGLAQRQGDDAAARSWIEESLAIHRAGGDLAGEAAALHGLGLLDARAGDVSSARSRYLNSLAIGRQLAAVGVVAAALANLGWLAQRQGDFATAHTLLEESLHLYRGEGASYGVAWSQYFLGRLSEAQGDLAGARPRYEESLALRRELGDGTGLADVLAALGSLALHEGDFLAARSAHQESLERRRALGDRAGVLESLRHLGDVARLSGEPEEARSRYRESLAIAEELGDACCVTRAHLGLAKVSRAERAGAEARAQLDQAVPEGSLPAPDALLAEWLEGVGGVAIGDARDDDGVGVVGGDALVSAARLWGAAHALRAVLGVPVPGGERAATEADVARGRLALGERRWDAAAAQGRALAPEAAVDEARRRLRRRPGR